MAITLAQILRYETVLKVLSRLAPSATQLSNFYGLSVTSPGTERAASGRVMGWDIFDNTRTMAKARAPYVGPSRTRPKATGHVTATCVRLYESIDILHEKVYGTRPLGGSFNEAAIDRTGQNYVGRQIRFGGQRMSNSMEFMVSRMFRGAFSVLIEDEDHFLRESGSGTVEVDFQVPLANGGAAGGGTPLPRIPLGTGGADIISASWDNPSTNIFGQLLALNKVAERQTGLPLTEFWIDSTTFAAMLSNSELAAVAGTAFRIFDTMTMQEVSTVDSTRRMSGLTVQFRAMPMFNFHVYDAVLNVDSQVDSDAIADVSQFIEPNYCIATPSPGGDWYGMGIGGEPIKENDESETEYKEGLSSWTKRMNDPPGEELRVLANVLPLIYIPKAIYRMEVIF